MENYKNVLFTFRLLSFFKFCFVLFCLHFEIYVHVVSIVIVIFQLFIIFIKNIPFKTCNSMPRSIWSWFCSRRLFWNDRLFSPSYFCWFVLCPGSSKHSVVSYTQWSTWLILLIVPKSTNIDEQYASQTYNDGGKYCNNKNQLFHLSSTFTIICLSFCKCKQTEKPNQNKTKN